MKVLWNGQRSQEETEQGTEVAGLADKDLGKI
jgi:hypothetical protein